MALRALIIVLLASAGCEETPLVTLKMTTSFADVFVPGGGGSAMPASASGDPSTQLFAKDLTPLGRPQPGSDLTDPLGCKAIPFLWLPTSGVDVTPTLPDPTTGGVTGSMCTLMSNVTLGKWTAASATVKISSAGDQLTVRVSASNLIANAVYSAWIFYTRNGTDYAVGPIGGLPNLLLTDANGDGSLERRVPARMLRANSLLINTVPTRDPNAMQNIGADTMLVFALYYHSDAQSNGNGDPTPPGRVAIVGRMGRTSHRQLEVSTAPLP